MTARLSLIPFVLCTALAWSALSAESEERPPEAGGRAKAVTETVKRLVEEAREAPPRPLGEQLGRHARTASRYLKPLSLPVSIGATLVGFALLLFGRRLFRAGVFLYMIAFMGFVGHAIGGLAMEGGEQAEAGGGSGTPWSLIGGLLGCLAGAGIAVPLRAAVRFLIGAFAGGILAFVIVQAVTSNALVTILATMGGILLSGFLTFIYPTPLLIVGFSMFGAALASVGILSVATEPVVATTGEHLAYSPAHVAGVVFAAVLGAVFQSQFEVSDEEGG